MKFRSEKELAILLVAMVCFMALQTFCLIDLDKRVDDLIFGEKTVILVQHPIFCRTGKTKRIDTGEPVGATEKEPEICQFQSRSTKESLDKKKSFDYDFEVVCQSLTAESGTDKELCLAVAQCLYNACEKQEWQYTPSEVLDLYQYADGVEWISTQAKDAYEQVFLRGDRYELVKNATLFYAPRYCKSDWHEQQSFVCEINGVRFFEEKR